MTTQAVREAVECAAARALCWLRGVPWAGWGINGPSPWREGGVRIDADGALAEGLIGVRHYAHRSHVYVTKAGRALLPRNHPETSETTVNESGISG